MFMRYDFDHLPDRRPTESVKWNRYEPDVLPLWVADMDFPVAEPIQRALRERVDHGIFGYPDVFSDHSPIVDFKQIIIERMENLYNWPVIPEEILLLPGVLVGLSLTCLALAAPAGNVIVQTPVYPPFLHIPLDAGMERHDALLERRSDGSYEIDWDRFEAAFNRRSRLFILCNPHNPVGRVFRQDELEHMADICLKHGVVICSDEIHCDLIYKGRKHLPIASLDEEIAKNTITLMAPTKTFNIAGLQCSFAIVQNQELHKQLEKSMKGLVMWINLFGLIATIAAYRDGQEWLGQVIHYLEGNRDYLSDYVRDQLPDLQMVKPEGTYLAWLDCHNAGIQGDPCEFFIKEARVALNDGANFGKGGEGFLRLNFACSWVVLSQALERMKAALEKVSG
jgi:cystathionine beta-lyase